MEEGGEQRWVHRHEVVGQLSLVETCFLQRMGIERTPHAEAGMAEVGPVELPLVVIRSVESAVVPHKLLVATGRLTSFPGEGRGTTGTVIAPAPAAAQLEARAGVPEACLH